MAISRATNILTGSIFLATIIFIIVPLRFLFRQKQGGLKADDWLIIPAAVVVVGLDGIVISGVFTARLGRPLERFPDGRPDLNPLYNFLKATYAIQISDKVAAVCIKASILMLYLRIFRGNLFKKACWALMVINISYGIGFMFPLIFQCRPVSAAWRTNPLENHQQCLDVLPLWCASAVANCVLDFLILLLPQVVVWRLQMPKRQKAAISAIFLLGLFATGVSVARVIFFFDPETSGTGDPTYAGAPALFWTAVEYNVGAICACLPAFAPAYRFLGTHAADAYIRLRSLVSDRFSIRSGEPSEEHLAITTHENPFEKGHSHNWTSSEYKNRIFRAEDTEANNIGVQKTFTVERT